MLEGTLDFPPLQPSTQTTMEPLVAEETQLELGQEDSKSKSSALHGTINTSQIMQYQGNGLGL